MKIVLVALLVAVTGVASQIVAPSSVLVPPPPPGPSGRPKGRFAYDIQLDKSKGIPFGGSGFPFGGAPASFPIPPGLSNINGWGPLNALYSALPINALNSGVSNFGIGGIKPVIGKKALKVKKVAKIAKVAKVAKVAVKVAKVAKIAKVAKVVKVAKVAKKVKAAKAAKVLGAGGLAPQFSNAFGLAGGLIPGLGGLGNGGSYTPGLTSDQQVRYARQYNLF